MASSESQKQISATLMVDDKKNKVLYAEAGKDFVGVLLSIFTLPLGTVSKLLMSKDSSVEARKFNCITSLRRSVEYQDSKYFNSDSDKEILLKPKNLMGYLNRQTVSDSDDTTAVLYHFGGFLRETACFVVSNDQLVMSGLPETTLKEYEKNNALLSIFIQ
ncbi:uncharacterized protein LOC129290050 [Prosopis cineraria]|uniref:uncharacterized protein LOC129290050 n=1 Tax=Prosopis cineraria TaxID=364024 RepID=UPI00240F7F88|nr:uncharacterized protein LOC129290050 [Prosopis cineraria]